MGASWCTFDKDDVCDDMFNLDCSAWQYCRGSFSSSCFSNTDTKSCTAQMLAMYRHLNGDSSQYDGTCPQGQSATIECSDNMQWIIWLATVTMIIAFILLVTFGVLCIIQPKPVSKSITVNGTMAAVLLISTIPAVAGCWSFANRSDTYDIGPADQVGFFILYFIFVIPALIAWAIALCCCMNSSTGDGHPAQPPAAVAYVAYPTPPPPPQMQGGKDMVAQA